MARFLFIRHGANERVWFICPGCESGHAFTTKGPVRWTVSGEGDRLTFAPSLLVDAHDPARRCHSFVRAGRIQFLADCHHALAGQTVDIPDQDDDAGGLYR